MLRKRRGEEEEHRGIAEGDQGRSFAGPQGRCHLVLPRQCLLQQLRRELQEVRRTGKRTQGLQLSRNSLFTQEKYFHCKYPDLFYNRANVESHLENYETAIKDYNTAHEIEPSAVFVESVQRINTRMEFTRQAFQRAVRTVIFRASLKALRSMSWSKTFPTLSTTTRTT